MRGVSLWPPPSKDLKVSEVRCRTSLSPGGGWGLRISERVCGGCSPKPSGAESQDLCMVPRAPGVNLGRTALRR